MRLLKRFIIPHLVGLGFILVGWYISIVSVGLDRFTSVALMSESTIMGLLFILAGAYIPEIWIGVIRLFDTRKEEKISDGSTSGDQPSV